jgi:aspartate/methionine/tyrosine aminotransferase
MTVTRLRDIPGIGVDVMGDAADAAADPGLLRLENLDTDIRPPRVALEVTRAAIDDDAANSYLPFQGHRSLRAAAAAHVGRIAGRSYDPATECVSVAGGLNGILNTLLATVEPGQEVVLCDPIYAGLVNRVLLAGGVPRFVRCQPGPGGWTVDPGELAAAVGPATAAVLMMGPAMPTGLVLGGEHWSALGAACERHDAWLIYDAAMERIRFDGRGPSHPAADERLAVRTITVGSSAKELRMIGWRVGWVTGPAPILADIRLVGLTNVVCQVGLAQQAVAAALDAPDADADVAAATAQWQRRCAVVLDELSGYPAVAPQGGWSLLIDTRPLGLTPAALSALLFDRGRVAATPMDGWGPSGAHYLRIVFANEPPERLAGLGERFRAAIG